MKKLNRVISVGVVASAMLMASAMENIAATKAKQANMLRTDEMKACNLQITGMGITMDKMGSKMNMG